MKVVNRCTQAKFFIFLMAILLLFCESELCSQALDSLLFYLMPQSDPQLFVQHYKQTRICSVFTTLSISSLISIVPHENFGVLGVGSLNMYFQLFFLRSLNLRDVFLKSHSCKADICVYLI